MELLLYNLQLLFIMIISYGVAAYRDATKEMEKKWNNGLYDGYFSHAKLWHLQTTAIWVVLLIAFAIITRDWKVLLLGIPFLNLDWGYYFCKKFINPALTFLPDSLNWFITDWDSKFNPFKLYGKDFDKREFTLTLIITNIFAFFLINILKVLGY